MKNSKHFSNWQMIPCQDLCWYESFTYNKYFLCNFSFYATVERIRNVFILSVPMPNVWEFVLDKKYSNFDSECEYLRTLNTLNTKLHKFKRSLLGSSAFEEQTDKITYWFSYVTELFQFLDA